MIKSMTAYSRASLDTPFGRFVIEIHSVNRKMLDLSVYLPKDLMRFDIDVRKWLSSMLERGQITLRMTMQSEGNRMYQNQLAQLKTLKEGWESIAKGLGFHQEAISLPFLVGQMQTAALYESREDEEVIKGYLKQVVQGALKDLMTMKEHEGKTLSLDMNKRLDIIDSKITVIESKREEPLHRHRKKIHERLKEIGGMQLEMEERLAREIALMAEKMDITEELVRLRAHIEQFRSHLHTKEKAIGRTLDFLIQEMHREINTLGVKGGDGEISQAAITIKAELEKIREQVQNIE